MASVIFTYNDGRKRLMPERDAKIMAKLKKGTYGVAADVPAVIQNPEIIQPPAPLAPAPADPANTAPSSDGLDEMSREELLKFAEESGLKIHGRTGDEKIRETLREHFK